MNAELNEMDESVFDKTANEFTATVDRMIQRGRYRRGELFMEAAGESVIRGGSILDYGCGPGRISLLLAKMGFHVIGIDPSEAMIASARQQPNADRNPEFRVCSSEAISIPQSAFDGIVCSSVIEYVSDELALLQSFHSALRPNGVLIISFANSMSLWRQWRRFLAIGAYFPAQRHLWSWKEFRTVLKCCGFEPINNPRYFDAPFEWVAPFRCSLVAVLGLVVARRVSRGTQG